MLAGDASLLLSLVGSFESVAELFLCFGEPFLCLSNPFLRFGNPLLCVSDLVLGLADFLLSVRDFSLGSSNLAPSEAMALWAGHAGLLLRALFLFLGGLLLLTGLAGLLTGFAGLLFGYLACRRVGLLPGHKKRAASTETARNRGKVIGAPRERSPGHRQGSLFAAYTCLFPIASAVCHAGRLTPDAAMPEG